MDKPIDDPARAPSRRLLFQRVYQLDGREEPDPLMVTLDGLYAVRDGDVCIARAGSTNLDNVVGVDQKVAPIMLLHERLVDLAAGKV